jgi:tetratricopeptide (TPR) repeat protein
MSGPVPVPPLQRFLRTAWPAALIGFAAFAAYLNTFSSPLLLDDLATISENHSIRNLGAWGEVLNPPKGITSSGRPILNLSFALNYALSRQQVWSYHALNLLIHVAAGLALFGFVHRTLRLPSLRDRFGADARPLALLVALLWTLHPLQTESVTYIVQRAESLMGLFYLLTLYCYVRSVDAPSPARWQVLAVVSCALGMATKEVMVTAPLLVLLHDRAFVAGSFRIAWAQRQRLYYGLEGTWAVLGWLVAGTGLNRDGSIGLGVDAPFSGYWLAQIEALGHYLKLSFWPYPQVFEYGWFQVGSFSELAPWLLLVAPLAGLTLYTLWRQPRVGFLGAWFFGILALTSIMPGTTQVIVEHRIYLSLAAIAAGVVLAGHAWLGRKSWAAWALVIFALGALTVRRNQDYRSARALWDQTLEQRPENGMALCSVGQALMAEGRTAEAMSYFERALKSPMHRTLAEINLALALDQVGRTEEALHQLAEALQENSSSAELHRYYGALLSRHGRHQEAMLQLTEAGRLKPDDAKNFNEIGVALGRAGLFGAALAYFELALQLDPGSPVLVNNLGNTLLRLGRQAEARARFEEVLRLQPDFAEARGSLARLEPKAP